MSFWNFIGLANKKDINLLEDKINNVEMILQSIVSNNMINSKDNDERYRKISDNFSELEKNMADRNQIEDIKNILDKSSVKILNADEENKNRIVLVSNLVNKLEKSLIDIIKEKDNSINNNLNKIESSLIHKEQFEEMKIFLQNNYVELINKVESIDSMLNNIDKNGTGKTELIIKSLEELTVSVMKHKEYIDKVNHVLNSVSEEVLNSETQNKNYFEDIVKSVNTFDISIGAIIEEKTNCINEKLDIMEHNLANKSQVEEVEKDLLDNYTKLSKDIDTISNVMNNIEQGEKYSAEQIIKSLYSVEATLLSNIEVRDKNLNDRLKLMTENSSNKEQVDEILKLITELTGKLSLIQNENNKKVDEQFSEVMNTINKNIEETRDIFNVIILRNKSNIDKMKSVLSDLKNSLANREEIIEINDNINNMENVVVNKHKEEIKKIVTAINLTKVEKNIDDISKKLDTYKKQTQSIEKEIFIVEKMIRAVWVNDIAVELEKKIK